MVTLGKEEHLKKRNRRSITVQESDLNQTRYVCVVHDITVVWPDGQLKDGNTKKIPCMWLVIEFRYITSCAVKFTLIHMSLQLGNLMSDPF